MILTWLLGNRTHLIYIAIIVAVGLLTNAVFGRYKVEQASRVRWEKAWGEKKYDVRVHEHQVIVKVPVEVAGQVVYKVLSSWDSDTLDKSVDTFGHEAADNTVIKKVEGQIPVFTLGLGVKVADQLDVAAYLNARLYGALGAWVLGNSVDQFKGYGVYAGVSYSR